MNTHPLGRLTNHDPRNLNHLAPADNPAPNSRTWRRYTPILDQGSLGSCTGNATTGLLGTGPLYGALHTERTHGLLLDEDMAVHLYRRATEIDPFDGTYPPTDTGSSGLAAAKAAQENGLIASYTWITSMDAAHTTIKTSPFMVGVHWYDNMFNPDPKGQVTIGGNIAGGHEFAVIGYSAKWNHWKCVNSWGDNWGKGGYFYLNNDTLTRLLAEDGDATVLHPLGAA